MSGPLRVLIVEDSQADARLLVVELERGGYEVTCERVETAAAMGEALDRQSWDVVLSDYVMPTFDGLAALKLLQAKGIDIPFIVVSGQIGEEVAVATMKAGASDYIVKGRYERLVPAIGRELREAQVRRQCRKAEEDRDRIVEQLRQVNEQLVLNGLQVEDRAGEIGILIATIEEALARYKGGGKA